MTQSHDEYRCQSSVGLVVAIVFFAIFGGFGVILLSIGIKWRFEPGSEFPRGMNLISIGAFFTLLATITVFKSTREIIRRKRMKSGI
jgi:hypothetical protein